MRNRDWLSEFTPLHNGVDSSFIFLSLQVFQSLTTKKCDLQEFTPFLFAYTITTNNNKKNR